MKNIPEREEIPNMYKAGMSCRKIAKAVGLSEGAVHSILRVRGIKMRDMQEQLKLSYKCRKGSQHPNWKGGRVYRGTKRRYIMLHRPNHPNCDTAGYVMEHRLVMETHLGRFLDKTEYVHHINGNPHDNCLDNLRIVSKKEHSRTHFDAVKEVARLKAILEAHGIAY